MSTHFFCGQRMDCAEVKPFASGRVGVFSAPCPGKDGPNEDAVALVEIDRTRGVLVVADGMGGGPAGEEASQRAVRAVAKSVAGLGDGGSLRESVLDGLEAANRSVPRVGAGAATTLAVAEIDGRSIRTYHVGDSGALIVGQRGRVKHVTVAHSPTGYAVEAGLMDEEEALAHDERHLVSNVVGSAEMKIEVGPTIQLSQRDTLLLASDGVFDNLRLEEICDLIRVGPVGDAAARLAAEVRRRMAGTDGVDPAKPDDWTFAMYRPTPQRSRTSPAC